MTDYQIKNGSHQSIKTTTTAYDYFEVYEGVFAYKMIENVIKDGNDLGNNIRQGITGKSGLALLRKGILPKGIVNTKSSNKGNFNYVVLSDELLEESKRFGYHGMSQRDYKGYDDTKVYDWLIGGGSLDNVVAFYHYDHSFWRLDGTLLPTGIYFDYIDAAMRDGKYDLAKALEILKQNEAVSFFDPQKGGGKTMTERASEGAVLPVPYYNSHPGQSQYLSFLWTPTQEQAEKLYENRMDRFKVVFDDDMLGLRSGGAALFDSFYKEVERSYDEDD